MNSTQTAAPARAREFEFTLPVGFVDSEGNLHRNVTLRKMTGREESILADRRLHKNGGRLVTELLQSSITRLGSLDRGFATAVSKMYSADRNFLLIKLRSITFGPEMQATYSCSCGESISVSEDLDRLPIRGLLEGESPEEIRVELEDGWIDRDDSVHTALTLRLPTGEDEEIVASQMRQNASLGKNALLARCLKSLGDVAKHRLEAMGPKILSDLTMTDRRLIDRALNEAAPGINLVRQVECPSCGRSFSAALDLSRFLAVE